MLQKICASTIKIISAVIILFLLVASIISTSTMASDGYEHTVFHIDFIIFNILFIVIAVLAIAWMGKKGIKICFSQKSLRILTIFFFIGAVTLLLVLHPSVYSDSKAVLDAAANFLEADYTDWKWGGYCYRYSNQNGLALYFILVSFLFGSHNNMVVCFFNIFFYWGSAVYLAKIVSSFIQSAHLGEVIYVLVLFFFPMECYIYFAYGTIPGLFCSLYAIWQLLLWRQTGRLSHAFCTGIFMMFSVLLKSNYLIFCLALLLFLLADSMIKKNPRGFLAAIVISLFVTLGQAGVSVLFETVTGAPTDQGIPASAWIAMGLQENEEGTPGWYNGYNYNIYVTASADKETASRMSAVEISNILHTFWADKKDAASFFTRKTLSQWNNPDFQGYWILLWSGDTGYGSFFRVCFGDGQPIRQISEWLLDKFLMFTWLGNLCYLWYMRKDHNIENYICYIPFIGGFLFHIFWEGKCQYTVVYFFLLIPYMLLGLHKIYRHRRNYDPYACNKNT